MTTLNFDFLNENVSTNKNKWDFNSIYNANILGVKNEYTPEAWQKMKADKSSPKGKTRNFLRKKLELFYNSFLSNKTDKELKLKTAINVKNIIITFCPSKASEYSEVFNFLQSVEKPANKK